MTQPGCTTCSGGCATDGDAGFRVLPNHRRLSQKDDIFSRSFWDEQMGEGLSDWWTLVFSALPEHTPDLRRGIGK